MRRLCAFLALLLSPMCVAQVTGTFSVDKYVFAPGEPVFLNFTLVNQGSEAQDVVTADPYAFCSGYRVHVSRQESRHVACFGSYGGSCASGVITLAPHASRTERILLNYPNNSKADLQSPIKLPGDYAVDALRTIKYGSAGSDLFPFAGPAQSEIHQNFDLHVDGALKVDSAAYAPFVRQLASESDLVRREAARTLATIAPSALEPLLLTFATSKDYVLHEFAPLALASLSTEASLAALAKMLTRTEPEMYNSGIAAEYLGETHDPKWFPALLAFADRQGAMYLPDAAAAGGEAAIPVLLERLSSRDRDVRNSVIFALSRTGSRAAVPILISLLKTTDSPAGENPTTEAAITEEALRQLTHRDLPETLTDPWVDMARQRWEQWWLTSGRDAKTYRPGECVADVPLP